MGDIVVTGLASNDPVPGSYVDVLFAQGDVSGSAADYSIMLIGNRTTAGSATVDTVIYGPDTPVQLQTEQDAINLFGTGSELHRLFRRVIAINQSTSVYAIAVTESSGSKATLDITVTVTATANGTYRFFCGDESVDSSIVSGDSVTTVATAMKNAINSKTHWPIVATNVAGVITVTAKNKGLRGNWIRIMAQVIGTSVGTTTDNTADTYLAGGTTADSSTAALATLASRRFYYLVSAAEDATQLGALSTQVDTMAAPIVGMRQVFFGGSVDTLANATTIATGLNTARGEIVWAKNSEFTPAELAANQAAVEALFELGATPRCNFAGFGSDVNTKGYWRVPQSRLTSSVPSRADIKSALNNGLSPVGYGSSGSTYLVNRITTRSLTSSVADYRIRDRHKVTICDKFGDDLNAKNVLQFSGKKIANDPAKGALPPGSDVVTPTIYKAAVFGLIDVYDGNALLQDVAIIKLDTVVQRAASPTTRMTARIPLRPIDCLFQFGDVVSQVA